MEADAAAGTVEALYRFPVKGLSPEPLDSVTLTAGRGFPADRLFGFLRHGEDFDEAHPAPRPKTCFHMLARDGTLARLATRYDDAGDALTIDGTRHALATPEGRADAEAAIAAALGLASSERPRLVRGGAHRFTDVSVRSPTFMNAVSLINLASVRDLGERIGKPVDPLRFRGNIVFDGWPAWHELSLVDRTVTAGSVTLRILLRTRRCAATTVDPKTGVNDIFVPRHLNEFFGHADCGIYAEVVEGGTLSPGERIAVA
ncbi:MAG: MOSC domain-containing protein [Acuticoccus sp.]